jgi:putative ABC transport system permease protein
MFRLTRRSLWEHKRRLVSTIVAIVLGVGFMAGTFVLTDTTDRGFDDLFASANEHVDAQVQGKILFDGGFGGLGDQREPLDPAVLAKVEAVDGVSDAQPSVSTLGFGASNRILKKDGKPLGASQGPPTILENWSGGSPLSPYTKLDGKGPERDDEIALNIQAAEDGGFHLGDKVRVLGQAGPKDYTLVGTFYFGTAKSSGGAVSADFTLAEAQRIAGIGDRYNQVLAGAADGVSQQQLVDRIHTALRGGGEEVLTGAEAADRLSSDVQSGFSFFSVLLRIIGGIALLVDVFVISNTFSILVAQRTRELALLRAVGARRGQVLGSVLIEAVMVGLVGAAIGLGFGILLASLFTGAIDLPTSGLAVRGPTVLVALLVGLGVTMVAALMPAIRATRVPPLAALRDVAIERAGASRTRIVIGVLTLVLGLFQLTAGWRGGSDGDDIGPAGFGALLLIVSAIVIGPVLAGPTMRAFGVVVGRLRGVTGRLASENAARAPKRTSATASALIIGVALVGFIQIFAASTRASISQEVSRGFKGDFAVQSNGGFGGPSPFPTRIADEVAKVPGVKASAGLGFDRAELSLGDAKPFRQYLSAADPTQLRDVLAPRMAEGSIDDLTDTGIVVDAGEAEDHHIRVGDAVHVLFAGGKTADLEVQAISDEENLLGYYTITRSLYLRSVPQPTDFMVFGKLDGGARSFDQVKGRIDDVIDEVPTLEVVDRDGFIGNIADQISAFVNFISVLLLLAVVIAIIGIANTLSLSIHERTREMGLLRAVGMNRKQLKSSIRWEAIMIALLGTAVGILLAVVASRGMLQALHSQGLVAYRLPIRFLVFLGILSCLIGVLAAWLPSRRAARLAILDAIAHT